MMVEKVILVIRDGWGHRDSCIDNCICQAPTPRTDFLMSRYPNVLIDASGEAVGLPGGYQGNSEVGHMTIGAARIMLQSLERINHAIKSGEFFENRVFLGVIRHCKKTGSRLHIMGLLQSEGVHAHFSHLHALLELCMRENFRDVDIHVFTDGRDAPVTASTGHIKNLLKKMDETGVGRISTVSGRYYSMDRNNVWERTEKAYRCIAEGRAEKEFSHALDHVFWCHKNNQTDEFIEPAKSNGYEGVKDGDGIIFYNFRTDRTRQLTRAFVDDDFEGFEKTARDIYFVAMTRFYTPMNARVAFEDDRPEDILGEVIADAGLSQLRISETEKYAHVTFFLNGQNETPYEGEKRIMIPSPSVATYDLEPRMSAYAIRDALKEEIEKGQHHLIVVNFVNCDMVGHTGNVKAIKEAVTAVDECVGDIVDAGLENGYNLLVFADHGNAEDQTPDWRTSHTMNPVPLIVIGPDFEGAKLRQGMGLKDIAPTALSMMGLDIPTKMSGKSIIA